MNEKEILVLKVSSCPSLSNRSILTYHIGRNGDEVHFRLVENSQGGLFSKEWLSLELVESFLASEINSVTSGSLNELFKGKSVNSGGFMLAVLKNEGLVQSAEGIKRSYVRRDPAEFKKAVQGLMESELATGQPSKPVKKQKKEPL